MSPENYELVRLLIHGGTLGMAALIVFLYHRYRRPISTLAKVTLFFAAFVCIKSAVFPYWCWTVGSLPLHEEGMAVAILHLFFIGPLALITLVASAFQREIRWAGIGLSLGYVVFSPIVLIAG